MAVSFLIFISCGAGEDTGELTVYVLTITNDGNGTTVPSGSVDCNHGVAINIEATPEGPYSFMNWTITSGSSVTFGNANSASTTVTLTDGDATIQANFTPLPTAVTSPASGSLISESISIVITFNTSMDTDSLILGGSMALESNGGAWSTITFTDDTLTISPSTKWTVGNGRTLSVDCDDLFGNSLSTLVLIYTIPVPIELITINAANDSFSMGDGSYGPPADHSGLSQTISYNFQISKHEITNYQYTQFISDGGYSTSSYWTTNGWNYKESQGWTVPAYWVDSSFNGINQPVNGVSWYEAVAFCNWLSAKEGLTQVYNSSGQANLTASGYRLPTEVEWEYADAKGASGTSERIYAFGDTWDCTKVVSNVSPCSSASQTADVGSKSPSGDTPQGLADMSGNVAEWCNDNWQPDDSVVSDTDRYYFVDDQDTINFVLRGGNFLTNNESQLRGSFRNIFPPPFFRSYDFGFRIVRL